MMIPFYCEQDRILIGGSIEIDEGGVEVSNGVCSTDYGSWKWRADGTWL